MYTSQLIMNSLFMFEDRTVFIPFVHVVECGFQQAFSGSIILSV